MNPVVNLICPSDLAGLNDLASSRTPVRLDLHCKDQIFETKFLHANRPSNSLIVWLNASIDREAKTLPAFTGNLARFHADGHQIAIADPTLNRYPKLRHTWYIGDAQRQFMDELVGLLEDVAKALSVTRIVLVGGSAGGFGALALSRRLANSCAVVLQPQTIISQHIYYPAYVKTCWPDGGIAELPATMTDMCAAYAEGFTNGVVYVQGMGDTRHFWNHCMPFMRAVEGASRENVVFHIDFWGKFGHAPIPQNLTAWWIRAALQAPTTTAADLLSTFHEVRESSQAFARTKRAERPAATKSHSPQDIGIADAIRDQLLRDGNRSNT